MPARKADKSWKGEASPRKISSKEGDVENTEKRMRKGSQTHILSNDLGVDQWRTVERRRRDAQDLGDVFDAAGVRIGRVTERDGSLVRWVEAEAGN